MTSPPTTDLINSAGLERAILVTGCAGFIGAKVSELLLAASERVVGWDNLNDAYDRRLKQWRLAQLQDNGLEFTHCDVDHRDVVEREFISVAHSCKAIVHLAARAGVRPSVENPWLYVDTNATGTLNLLDACRRYRVPKFVLASTSSLYGGHNRTPYREDADTSRPLSPYAASKLAAEGMAHAYHHLHGLDITVLRFFTVYGPAGRPDMSVFRFVRNITEGEPIVVFGDGEQQRDFTYVDDIARGVVAALRPLGYAVINLGNDRPAKLSRLIELIEHEVGQRATIERRPAHPADVPATWADIGAARKLLSWSPETDLQEGIHKTVAWYRENRAIMSTISTGAP